MSTLETQKELFDLFSGNDPVPRVEGNTTEKAAIPINSKDNRIKYTFDNIKV